MSQKNKKPLGDSFLNKNSLNCIGSCYAPLALREDYREHLRIVQKEIGFKYIRFHGIFHDNMGVYKIVKDEKQFNFHNIFKIYDFFLSVGLKQIVEFGFMPYAMASGTKTVFDYRANVTPPKSYDDWAELIEKFMEACIERYGVQEMSTWRYEVWNEPNLGGFWDGDMEEYFKLYECTARTIKKINPVFKVGGPATAANAWVEETIDFCNKNDVPLDFLSTHHYCVDGDLILTEQTGKHINYRGQDRMAGDVEMNLKIMENKGNKPMELHYTEWNVSPAHEDVFGKDSEFNAVFVLKTLMDIAETKADSYSYWTFSDIFEESSVGTHPFTGKYGLLNIHGIRKPVFYTFKWFSDLYEEIVEKTDEYIITRSAKGDLRILNWNLCEPAAPDHTNLWGGDWEIPLKPSSFQIALAELEGEYRVQGWKINKECGNAYRKWQEIGSPQYLKRETEQILHESSKPVSMRDEIVEGSAGIQLENQLEPQEINYWILERI